MEPYLTSSWLKDLLFFLHPYSISLEDSVPKLKKTRMENDQFLMEYFILQGYRGKELTSLNSCQQVLQVTMLAEIAPFEGDSIARNAWIGKKVQPEVIGWPHKPIPSWAEWHLWQAALPPLLRLPHSLHLQQTLGD
jgi:hypothetical protein